VIDFADIHAAALLNASHTVMDVPGLPTLCPRVFDALALYRHR
jgi:hypothetical protein